MPVFTSQSAPRPGTRPPTPALETYEAFAPVYDRFTEGYAYEAWLANIERLARALGLAGSRALDVACGTGKSFLPLRARGWEVTACDLSPSMVARARAKLPAAEAERVLVADMRVLPPLGPFDLVTCLDDAVNYLLSPAEVTAALCSMAGCLRPGGLLVFDLNSRAAYRDGFDDEATGEGEDLTFRVSGAPLERADGRFYRLTVEARGDAAGAERRRTIRHVQRHHPRAEIEAACGEAGLSIVAVRGQVAGGRLVRRADEEVHRKLLYVARRDDAPTADRWR